MGNLFRNQFESEEFTFQGSPPSQNFGFNEFILQLFLSVSRLKKDPLEIIEVNSNNADSINLNDNLNNHLASVTSR